MLRFKEVCKAILMVSLVAAMLFGPMIALQLGIIGAPGDVSALGISVGTVEWVSADGYQAVFRKPNGSMRLVDVPAFYGRPQELHVGEKYVTKVFSSRIATIFFLRKV